MTTRPQTIGPSPYGLAVDPSGMPEECLERLQRIVDFYGLTQIGKLPSPYGDIFLAERWNPIILIYRSSPAWHPNKFIPAID